MNHLYGLGIIAGITLSAYAIEQSPMSDIRAAATCFGLATAVGCLMAIAARNNAL